MIAEITGRGGSLPPDEHREVLDRQVQVAVRMVAIANVANIASIVLTAYFAVPPGAFRTWWVIASLLVISNSCRMWSPWVFDPHRPAGRRERVLLTVDVVIGGSLYGVLGAHVVPLVIDAKQVILVSTIVGVIGSGAIALSTVRSLGWAWATTIAGGLAIGFLADASDEMFAQLAQLALYFIAITSAIEYLSWSFEQRYRAERAAERERELVTLLLDDFEGGSRDWLWRTNPRGLLVSPSSRLVECSGLDPHDLERRTIAQVAGGSPIVEQAMEAATAFRDVVVSVSVAGEERWWSLSGIPRPDGSWRGVGADVTEQYEHEQEIRHLASFDSLTGLANRHRLRHELQALVARRGPDQQISVAILDLDNFKAVNDTLGHPIGDRLLAEVAGRLRTSIPEGSTCARLGGDEFAIVSLVDQAHPEPADTTAFLDSMFGQPFLIDGTRLEIRGSVGHALIPGDAADADEAVMLADLALYAAKDGGRGKICAFEPAMRAASEARARALEDLRQAIDAREFEVWFQPLVTATGAVGGFEALARWHHPTHGWIPPCSFIPVAEETGLIVPLGELLLDLALATAASLPEHLRLAVNVAPVQLVSTGFAERFHESLQRWAIDPARLDVEITESAVLDPDAHTAISNLRHLGCGVAIDDFGTGYSSFAALQDMPITQLKVDRAFIARLDRPEGVRARAIVKAIVDVAEASGLTCVAEGVETLEQQQMVLDLGCHFVQGYIVSKPMPPTEVPRFLATRGA